MIQMKIEKEYKYEGLGFPVILCNVPMVKIREKWILSVSYNKLMEKVIFELAFRKFRLTGNQIRFIRQFFEMSLKQFSNQFDVDHTVIIKWEDAKNKCPINMSIERDIRFFILFKMGSASKMFKELYERFNNKNTISLKNNLLKIEYSSFKEKDD